MPVARTPLLALVLAGSLAGSSAEQTPSPRQSDEQQRGPLFTAATDVVPLNVTVSGEDGRAIVRLRRKNFKVYEDGIEQTISLFRSDQAPASWGLVLDRSGSMRDMIDDVYQAALHAIDDGTDEDETFIATFHDQV